RFGVVVASARTFERANARMTSPMRKIGGRARVMRRGVSVLSRLILLFGLVHALGAGTLEARQTPADTAAITLDVAGTLEAEGKGKAARALLELIVRRYPGTPAAAEASLR